MHTHASSTFDNCVTLTFWPQGQCMPSDCQALYFYQVWCWWTHTHTHKVTDATDYLTRSSATAGMGNWLHYRPWMGAHSVMHSSAYTANSFSSCQCIYSFERPIASLHGTPTRAALRFVYTVCGALHCTAMQHRVPNCHCIAVRRGTASGVNEPLPTSCIVVSATSTLQMSVHIIQKCSQWFNKQQHP